MYPNTVQEAYNILQRREEVHNIPMLEGDRIAFAQWNGQDMSTVTCYSCHQTGHYANSPECPNYKGDHSGRREADGPPGGNGVSALMFSFYQANRRFQRHGSCWTVSQLLTSSTTLIC